MRIDLRLHPMRLTVDKLIARFHKNKTSWTFWDDFVTTCSIFFGMWHPEVTTCHSPPTRTGATYQLKQLKQNYLRNIWHQVWIPLKNSSQNMDSASLRLTLEIVDWKSLPPRVISNHPESPMIHDPWAPRLKKGFRRMKHNETLEVQRFFVLMTPIINNTLW